MTKNTMKNFHFLFHSCVYYITWFSCITLAARGFVWLGPAVAFLCVQLQIYWQYKIDRKTRGLWQLLALVVFTSTLVDSILVYSGIIIFEANPFSAYFTSPWMIAIWISFTVTLYATLMQLFNHLISLGLLSFIGFASAYAVGAKIGAAFFPYGYQTCYLIGGIWFILLPSLAYCYQKIMSIK